MASHPKHAQDTQRSGPPTTEHLKPWMWRPGQSGNPGGHNHTIAARIRATTHDGADLVDVCLRMALGTGRIAPRLRLEAVQILFDRGYGKPLQRAELSGPDGGPLETVIRDMSGFTGEQLRELVGLRSRLREIMEAEHQEPS